MAKTYDLTDGKVPGLILRFFFPMLLTNLLQQVYSMADTIIMYFLPRAGFPTAAWAEVAAWVGSLALNGTAYSVYIHRMQHDSLLMSKSADP